MYFCALKNYKVTYKCNYTILDFNNKVTKIIDCKILTLNGKTLRELIGSRLMSIEFFELEIVGNVITITESNVDTGENGWFQFEISELK